MLTDSRPVPMSSRGCTIIAANRGVCRIPFITLLYIIHMLLETRHPDSTSVLWRAEIADFRSSQYEQSDIRHLLLSAVRPELLDIYT